MALVCGSCGISALTPFQKHCDIKNHTRKGGIRRVGFIKCDYVFADITDPTEWQTAIADGDILTSPDGVGSKPATNKTTKKLTSCTTEDVVNKEHIINFRSYDMDLVNETDFDAWDAIDQGMGGYRLFWIGCDGLVYLHSSYATENAGFEVSGSVDYIQEEDGNDSAYFEAELKFNYKGIVKGYKLPGVVEVL